jgi:hypothetical protein
MLVANQVCWVGAQQVREREQVNTFIMQSSPCSRQQVLHTCKHKQHAEPSNEWLQQHTLLPAASS